MRARRLVFALVGVVLSVLAFSAVPALAAPTVEEASVLNATATSATLQASIVPEEGVETAYRFEYGTATAYGSRAPVSDGIVGSTATATTVEAHIQGLSAATEYHYRVVAVAGGIETDGADGTFTTQAIGGPSQLPDGRQWELVSPPNKHGAGIEALTNYGGAIQAAADGSAFTYVATGPVTSESSGDRAPESVQVFSKRTASGWGTQDISTPNNEAAVLEVGKGTEYRVFSPNLSFGMVEPRTTTPLSLEASEHELTLYRRDDSNGSYLPLVTEANVTANTRFGPGDFLSDPHFLSASPDLSHVVFSSQQPLTSQVATNAGEPNLFEWANGELQLVSVLPNGHPVTEPGAGNEGGPASLGGDKEQVVRDAVSSDGSLISWAGVVNKYEHLYLRDMTKDETVQLDLNEAGVSPPGSAGPSFQGASSDGLRVFFTSKEPLTSGGHDGGDLYVAEVVPRRPRLEAATTDLTEKTEGGEEADVKGAVVGYGEEGHDDAYVYFVADGRLTPDANAGECGGREGECTLYVDHYDGTKWVLSRVATLAGADESDWDEALAGETAHVSSNGRFLAFMSQRSLTGYDNRDAVSGMPDQEVFLYDAVANRLVCASCDPTGARPVGIYDRVGEPPLVDRASSDHSRWLAGSIPSWTHETTDTTKYQSRYLSDEGRLFFDATDALVPRDIDGLEDVYEYESPVGEGKPVSDSCLTGASTYSPRSGGCVNLVSSGTSAEESAFLDASESGDDVFFLTTSKLVSQDYDKSFDVYDAHVCDQASSVGACPSVVAEPPACTTADACRAAPAAQPGVFGEPPSETFSGAGNVAPVPALSAVGAKSKGLTRAQLLKRALRVCAKKPRSRRGSCEASARKRYSGVSGSKAKKSGRGAQR